MTKVNIGGRTYDVEVRGTSVMVDGHEFAVTVREEKEFVTVTAGGVPYRVQLPPPAERASGMQISVDYRPFTVDWEGRLGGGPAPREARQAAPAGAKTTAKGGIAAQIAGRIISVRVKPGDAVALGDVLLLLEAMKMENEIKAPKAGTVKEVLVTEGARVVEGETLVTIE
jgi:biotin carboxyl carrier protein